MKESPEKSEQIVKNDEDEKRESEFPRNLRKSCKFFYILNRKVNMLEVICFSTPLRTPESWNCIIKLGPDLP